MPGWYPLRAGTTESGGKRTFADARVRYNQIGAAIMLFLIIAATTPATPSKCALPFEVVSNEAAARAIAQVVIASAPPEPVNKDIAGYDLHIEYLRQRDSWRVYQSPISAIKGITFLGGNGLDLEIAACDGAVLSMSRQR